MKNDQWWMKLDSSDQWENFESIQQTKEVLRNDDPARSELPDDFFNQLHDKVMGVVNELPDHGSSNENWRGHIKSASSKSWRSWHTHTRWWRLNAKSDSSTNNSTSKSKNNSDDTSPD